MDSEVKIIISFLFKRSGKKQMNFSELYLNLSMDLHWFTPDYSKKILNYAIKNKLLIKQGTLIEPNIDINKITIPIGFSPSKNLQVYLDKKLTTDNKDLLKEIISRISEKSKLKPQEINQKIKRISKEKILNDEVTALLIAKNYGINIEDLYAEIENKIFLKPKE
jgi:hypothetical protein